MEYIQIQPINKSDILMPAIGSLNCFLDTTDNKFKGIDSNGNQYILSGTSAISTLQQVTNAGATTTKNVTVANINVSGLHTYADNVAASQHLVNGDLYVLPYNVTGDFYPIGVVHVPTA